MENVIQMSEFKASRAIVAQPVKASVVKPTTVTILVVADEQGREEWCGPIRDWEDDGYCTCSFSGDDDEECCCEDERMFSVFLVDADLWAEAEETDAVHDEGHATHWLAEHGDELCAGDFL
jgi:hypothetical protein